MSLYFSLPLLFLSLVDLVNFRVFSTYTWDSHSLKCWWDQAFLNLPRAHLQYERVTPSKYAAGKQAQSQLPSATPWTPRAGSSKYMCPKLCSMPYQGLTRKAVLRRNQSEKREQWKQWMKGEVSSLLILRSGRDDVWCSWLVAVLRLTVDLR